MIIRLVKMTFHQAHISSFRKIFDEAGSKIRQSEGCLHLDLLQDAQSENVFFTYSLWSDESDLERYRHSSLFKSTWARTKKLFSDKPEAWTTHLVDGSKKAIK